MSSDNPASYRYAETHPNIFPSDYISDEDIATFRVLDSEYLANEYAKRKQQEKWDKRAKFLEGERQCAENKRRKIQEEKDKEAMIGKSLDIAGLGLSICQAAGETPINKACGVAAIGIDIYQGDPCGVAIGVAALSNPTESLETTLDVIDLTYGAEAVSYGNLCPYEMNFNALTLEGTDNNESFLREVPYTSQSEIVKDIFGIDNSEKK
jgi:hypothetical protein